MKVLVDTCVWIAHFKSPNPLLIGLLESQLVFTHEQVLGELLVGNIPQRRNTLVLLLLLPRLGNGSFAEVMWFVERQSLNAKGLSWGDIHLLSSCILAGAKLYTLDARLNAQATFLGLAL